MQTFYDMLRLFGAGALGREITLENNLDIENIRRLSIEQGIWPVVYSALEKNYDVSEYKKEILDTVAKSIRHQYFTMNIIGGLCKKGIKCCLIKGSIVSKLYAEPDYRVSGDVDILISSNEEPSTAEYLIQNGYTLEKREKNDHHLKAYHPIGGLLEVHIRLYSLPTEKLIFNDLALYTEEWREVEINGTNIYTLGINDGLLYLTAHYIKHFVNEGGGVRQMMDLLLYMNRYKDSISFDDYNRILKELKYDKLVDVIKTIGAKYWGMDYPILCENLADRVLSDSLHQGIFGFSQTDRMGFYSIYCEKRNTNTIKSKYLLNFKRDENIIKLIFPKRENMLTLGYKSARYKFGLPIAWVCRIFRFMRKKTKPASSVETRLDLMQDLNMID